MEISRVKSRFPELLQLRLPAGTNEALDKLASLQHRTKSDLSRQTLLREVEAHGLTLGPALREVAAGDDGQMDIVTEALALVAKARETRHDL